VRDTWGVMSREAGRITLRNGRVVGSRQNAY
jgi:hypothetical protein